ncbi:hypothetical protein [Saccharopolyspora taberi]|uniref:Uncharacterized protein n=1 Tax=Saccharopolyspora taberi TaxID=60895 RepID=A0ABN3VHE0_9PSEU
MIPGAVPATGTRVRLRPSRRADIVDLALAGKVAEVDAVEHGADGRVYVVVSLLGDTAADLGPMSQIGHRFFFAPEELEPLSEGAGRRVLLAAVGDTSAPHERGVREVVRILRGRCLPPGVRVADFGIRRRDLLRTLADFDVGVLLCGHPVGAAPPIGLAHWAAELPSEAPGCSRVTAIGCGNSAESGEVREAVRNIMSIVDSALREETDG